MTLLGIQIFGTLFGFIMIYITFMNKKRKEFSIKESLFWSSAWSLFIIIVLFPTIFDFFIQDVLNLQRRLDFFIVLGFMFLIGLEFNTYIKVKKNKKKIDNIVRNIAIKNK